MDSNRPIYLDHLSTTPVDSRVLEAMLPFFAETFGNPASQSHAFGWAAEEAVEAARASLARTLNAAPHEIVFTSGATEANNLAIKSAVQRLAPHDAEIVTAATEHRSVLDSCGWLERRGYRVHYLPVQPDGLLNLDTLYAALTPKTALVSVMYANNEIGVIQPIAALGTSLRQRGILFHCDATQAVGKLPVDVRTDSVDLLALSAHKFYGPKGIGALFVRDGTDAAQLPALIHGGGQERGVRSGTLNVPGIVGLARAAEIASATVAEESLRIAALRDGLQARLQDELTDVIVNGHPSARLPHVLSVGFHGVDGDALFKQLGRLAVSRGSACAAAGQRASHVLRALGLTDDLAQATIRFGLGRSTTAADLEIAADSVIHAVRRLRG